MCDQSRFQWCVAMIGGLNLALLFTNITPQECRSCSFELQAPVQPACYYMGQVK
jgi:hypothetical protein